MDLHDRFSQTNDIGQLYIANERVDTDEHLHACDEALWTTSNEIYDWIFGTV